MADPKNMKRLTIRGGPTGAQIEELRLGDQNLLENAFGFKVESDVHGMIDVTIQYRVIDLLLEVEPGHVKHEVVLQKTIWRTNPVDGITEKTPHVEYGRVEVETNLADALRIMADLVEKGDGAERVVPFPSQPPQQ